MLFVRQVRVLHCEEEKAVAPKKKQNSNSQNDLQKEIEYLRMENAYLKSYTP